MKPFEIAGFFVCNRFLTFGNFIWFNIIVCKSFLDCSDLFAPFSLHWEFLAFHSTEKFLCARLVHWLGNMLARQKCWQTHLSGDSDTNTRSFKTHTHVSDIYRELDLQWIASAYQCIENRLVSIQHKLCKIA